MLLIEKFWSRVRQVDGCWLRAPDGRYGTFQGMGAHRWAYLEIIGPIPKGLDLDHLCNNPPCANPWHLEPVASGINMKRASQRGRMRNIYDHPSQFVPRYRSPAAYLLAVEFWAERIRSGEVEPGTLLTKPERRHTGRTTHDRGWSAAQKWLVAYGLAEIIDGQCFARKAV